MVSVIIPCHNCSGFIDRAVDSVLAQFYKKFEILLIENNSTDNTLRTLKKFETLYPEIVKVYVELKPGAPAARNCGLQNAKGEWIQFLDADDELLPGKIFHQITLANEFGADIIAGACLLKYRTHKKSFEIERQVDDDIWKGLITSNLGITSSNLWRKDALMSVGGWNEKLSSSQEYDLLFRMLKQSALIIPDHELNTIVHFSQNSVSKSTNKEKLEKIIDNRIKLRLQIKEALTSQGMLNAELGTTIDKYIYTELISNSVQIPEYCADYLKHRPFDVDFGTKFKVKTRHYLKQVRSALNM